MGKSINGLNLPEPEKHILLIFNHGSTEERHWDTCVPTTWTVPEVIRQLSGKTVNGLRIAVYNLCSAAPGAYDATVQRGEPKILKRAQRIEESVRAFAAAGVPPQQIFLVGHSAGGWAALLVAQRHKVAFNAVIAFGPAFAGKKADRSPGWQTLRVDLAGMLAGADHIDGLVYAYAHDPFESAADLEFLGGIDGIRLVPVEGEWGGCGRPYGHRTAFQKCFAQTQTQVILDYIQARLAATF